MVVSLIWAAVVVYAITALVRTAGVPMEGSPALAARLKEIEDNAQLRAAVTELRSDVDKLKLASNFKEFKRG